MSRKKTQKTLPFWAYEDNPLGESGFGMVSADLFKSKKFQNLTPACRSFYIVLITHKNTKMQQECLFEYKSQMYREMGKVISDFDLNLEVHGKDSPEFVFPKVQYEQYGFTKEYVHKYMTELREHGFVQKKTVTSKQAHDRKVNLYEFSNAWKKLKLGEKLTVSKAKGNQTKKKNHSE